LIAGKECCFNFANIYTVVLDNLTINKILIKKENTHICRYTCAEIIFEFISFQPNECNFGRRNFHPLSSFFIQLPKVITTPERKEIHNGRSKSVLIIPSQSGVIWGENMAKKTKNKMESEKRANGNCLMSGSPSAALLNSVS